MNASRKGLRRYKVLVFDVIGTLIDFETGALEYLQPILESAGKSIADSAVLEALGWALSKRQKVEPGATFTDMLAPAYLDMAATLGLPADPSAAEGLKKSIPQWPAFGDSVDGLRALSKQYRLVALTNADNWAYWYLNKTLGDVFDDKVTAEDVGVSKPNAQMFAYCLGRQSAHGLTRNHVLHVARSQHHDIVAASGLGLATAWIERERDRAGQGAMPEPDEVVTPTYHFANLAELVDAVKEAFEG